ncbi:serine hydroxymethyltransferase [Candidatus Bathyarchaeota archaeon]|nr:serine hydroxymethyltransferase [Candidatus Bathyarchaeota archaeon]
MKGVLELTPVEYYRKVFSLLEQHHRWFQESIPLIASENVPSPSVREAIISDFGNRYAEGFPKERVYAGCKFIDEVEILCMEMARRLFDAEYADVRPVSGVNANIAVYTAFTQPNDIMMSLSIAAGGHISFGKKQFSGTAGSVKNLEIEYFPFNHEDMNIDVEATKEKILDRVKTNQPLPKLVMFGGSVLPFPHPVKELAKLFHDYGMTICYDAAHVAGLIAGGQFQDPLKEGADVMTISTHKTLFGPQGGAILSKEMYAETLKKAVFPATVSNHHLHHVAGKAVAFAEMLEFGKDYAEQVVENAQTLAKELYSRGFNVLGKKNGFTRSHVLIVDVSEIAYGSEIERRLEDSNIILNRNLLPYDIKYGRHYDTTGGIRIGVQECTRLGMKAEEMKQIAEFIQRVVLRNEDPERIRLEVADFRRRFQKVHYAFETATEAYEYIRIRS